MRDTTTRRRRNLERFACSVCGKAFYGQTVWDEDAAADAPQGICPSCQDDPLH